MRKGVSNTPFRRFCLRNDFIFLIFLILSIPFVYFAYSFIGLGFSLLGFAPSALLTIIFCVAVELKNDEWLALLGMLLFILLLSFIAFFWDFRF